jgi:hypothetical protein
MRAADRLPTGGAHLGRSRQCWRLADLDTGTDRERVGDRLPLVAAYQRHIKRYFPAHA